jgi:lysophospholipase L1-like esterase
MIRLAAVLCLCLAAASAAPAGEVAVKSGEKIVFLGDSITEQGMGPLGYVRLVIAGLKTNGVEAAAIGAGISGQKSNQMLARTDGLVSKKPEWMTISCGVNDVWHGVNGVPLDAYKTNLTAIVDKARAAGVKVMILTATVIAEDVNNANNQKLAAYNDFLRELAQEKKCLLADLNADFQLVLKGSVKPGNVLTTDGVHMNPAGNQLMAKGILRAFGLDDSQLARAAEAWLDIPNAVEFRPALQGSVRLTLRQLQQLEPVAAAHKLTVDQMVRVLFGADLIEGGSLKTRQEIEAFLDKPGKKDAAALLQERLTNRVDLLRQ